MPTIEIDASRARDEKELEALIVDRVMDHLADKIFQKSQENLIDFKAVDTGFLLKSGNVQRDFLEKTITYDAPYASVVEYGRTPGSMPPVKPIQQWAKRKLGLSDKEAKNAGFRIANAIKTKGTKPRPFLRKAIDDAVS